MTEAASESVYCSLNYLRIILLILNTRTTKTTVCAVRAISRKIFGYTRLVLVRIMVIACYRISCWKRCCDALLWRCKEGQHTPTLLQHYGRDFPPAQASRRPDDLHVSGTLTHQRLDHDQCLMQVRYELQTPQWNHWRQADLCVFTSITWHFHYFSPWNNSNACFKSYQEVPEVFEKTFFFLQCL